MSKTKLTHGIGCPHARGGGPQEDFYANAMKVLSPCSWGWSANQIASVLSAQVVPMLVGVVRLDALFCQWTRQLSPCSWGWSARDTRSIAPFRSLSPCSWGWSAALRQMAMRFPLSPCSWGWSGYDRPCIAGIIIVVPMLVGVVRLSQPLNLSITELSPCSWGWSERESKEDDAKEGCPHARGGGPRWNRGTPVKIDVVPMLVGVVR